MSEPLSEATGFAHAFSTWIAQGNGLDTKRDGVFRYKAGPMKGMTRDQALMLFQNKVWPNASPEWKNEYSRRGSTGMLAPNEQSDLEKRKASASGVTQPQYRQQMPQPTTDNGQVALLPAVYGDGPKPQLGEVGYLTDGKGNVARDSRTGQPMGFNMKDSELGSPARQGAQTAMETPVTGVKSLQGQPGVIGLDGKPIPMTGTPPAPTAVSQPQFEANKAAAQQRNATSVAKTAQAIQGKAPSNTPAGKFDMMTADYSTLTREQKDQRTQANVDKAKAKATSMGIPEAMPAMAVTAPRMKPLETKYDMAQGRVVKIGGDADEAYMKYDEAQNAARAGKATAQQRQTVVDYVSQDVLGRQPGQIAKQREDERKGYYEAGRYRGPAATAPTPVSNPVFTGNSSRPKTAPMKSPRQIGRQMGNRAAGMTI